MLAAKKSGSSPNQRRKYDDTFNAEPLRLASGSRSPQAMARALGISPRLLHRWQWAHGVAEVGSVEVARDPEVRAASKRLAQELGIVNLAPLLCQPVGEVAGLTSALKRAILSQVK